MYAESYYMPGRIKYYRVKRRRNMWMLPVFLCTFLMLGTVFLVLGYYAAGGNIGLVALESAGDAGEPEMPPKMQQPNPPQEPAAVLMDVEETPAPMASPQPGASPEPEKGPDLCAEPEKTKTMYLTFDDGPSAEYTDSILDTLAAYDIKATFFLVGENVEKRPEVAKRIVEEGHSIGIHCYSHAYDDIYDTVDSYIEDFEKAYQVIYETTGVEVKIFRFPGGSVNAYNRHICKDIITELTERGFVYFDWNASLEDAVKKTTPQELVQNAKDTAMERERVILLAHDTIYNTSLCIEDIILQFPDYKMEPLTEEVVPIRFRLK